MDERAAEVPATRLVQVGDRASDILALMQGAQTLGWPVDILVLSKHNRSSMFDPDEIKAASVLTQKPVPAVLPRACSELWTSRRE